MAIKSYENVVMIDSQYEPAWEALAYLYLELGESGKSNDILKKLSAFDGYTTIKSSLLYRVCEIAHKIPSSEKVKWLESFRFVDPFSQFYQTTCLEASYFNQSKLQMIFESSWPILHQTKEYEDHWLKWMLLSAIELNESKKASQLAGLYINQVIIDDPEIKALALYLSGNKMEARKFKSSSNKTVIVRYGKNFKKIFQAI
jgi:hypothetical protein